MTDSPIIRRFEALLPLLSRGKFVEKCDEHMRHAIETLEALPDGEGKASMTLTLDFVFSNGRLDVKPAVKSKLPEEKGFSGTPFWTMEGALSVQHPSQSDLFRGPRAADEDERRHA